MTETEKTLLNVLASAISLMSEREKWYFLGYAEGMVNQRSEKETKTA